MSGKQSKSIRRKNRNLNIQKAILSLLTTTMIANPVLATTITASSGTSKASYGSEYQSKVTNNGSVWTVTPGSKMKSGSASFNRFTSFSLDEGHIANLKLLDNTTKLYNFVTGGIVINGTVNSLLGSSIGGHLIFVSPEGMTVGAAGRINAGRFSAIVPTSEFYGNFVDNQEPWANSAQYDLLENGWIPLNRDKSIVVKGRITAPDGITLRASKISLENGSVLDTTTLDFSSLVNTGSASSGITGSNNLKLTRTGSGDILLYAQGTPESSLTDIVTSDSSTAEITAAGEIKAHRNVTARAVAANGKYDADNSALASSDTFAAGVSYADVSSKVVLAKTGKITAGGDTTIYTESRTNSEGTFAEKVMKYTLNFGQSFTPFDVDAGVTVISSDSFVDLQGSVLAGNNINIEALSTITANKGASANVIHLIDYTSAVWREMPALGTTVGVLNSKAGVAVGSTATLAAGKHLSVSAESDLTADFNANAAPYQVNGETQSAVAVAVSVLKSSASIDVAAGADVKASGDVKMLAKQKASVNQTAAATTSNKSYGGVTVNVSLLDTNASVNLASSIGNGDIVPNSQTIYADNTISKWNVKATDTAGTQGSPFKEAIGRAKDTIISAVSKRFLGSGDLFSMSQEHANAAWEAAGALAVVNGTQTSSINVADGVTLKANGNVSLTSHNTMSDHLWQATSQAGQGAKSNDAKAFAFAVVAATPSVSADLTLGRSSSVISVNGDVSLDTAASVEYNRLGAMVDQITAELKKIASIFAVTSSDQEWGKVVSKWETMTSDFSTLGGQNLSFLTWMKRLATSLGDLASVATSTLSTIKQEVWDDRISKLIVFIPNMMDILDFTNMANTVARSLANSSNASTSSGFNLAASANVNLIDVTSSLNVLPYATVQGTAGVSLSSSTENKNVAFGGNLADMCGIPWLVTLLGSGVGGTGIWQSLTSTGTVDVQQGAALKVTGSNGTLSINGKENSLGLGIVLSAGQAGSFGFEGMFSVLYENIANLARIDDQVTLSAPIIEITAKNSDYAQNFSGELGVTNGKSIGIGAAVNLLTYQTVARIADFDSIFSQSSSTDTSVGNIAANTALTLKAVADGAVNAVAVAAEIAGDKAEADQADGKKHWYDWIVTIAELPGKAGEAVRKGLISGSDKIASKINPKAAGGGDDNALELADLGGQDVDDSVSEHNGNNSNLDVSNQAVDGDNDLNMDNMGNGQGGNSSSLRLTMAGSAAWNSVNSTVKAGIEGTHLTSFSNKTSRSTTVLASENRWVGAFTGGAAISTTKGTGTTVGISGALSVNDLSSDVSASVKNSSYEGTAGGTGDELNVLSVTGGTKVATALALSVTSGKSGGAYALDAGVSVNFINSSVGSTVDGLKKANSARTLSLDVAAQEIDTQVTGGVNIGYAGGDATHGVFGAAVQVAKINDTVSAGIKNSELYGLDNVEVDALNSVTQVTAGLTTSLTSGSEGGTSAAFAGAFSYALLDNEVSASVENSKLEVGGTVLLQAKDTRSQKLKITADALSDDFTENKAALAWVVDLSGDSYYKSGDSSLNLETEGYYNGSRSGDVTTVAGVLSSDRSLIITASVAVAGSGNALGTGIAISDITNSHSTTMTSVDLSAPAVKMVSDSGTQVVGVAAGGAIGTKSWALDGSVVWTTVANTAKNTISGTASSDAQLSAGSLSMEATNRSTTVDVAGEVTYADKVALGATIAYGKTENNARNAIASADIVNLGNGASLTMASANKALVWDVAIGVGASQKTTINGSVALSRVKGETTDEITDSSIKTFKNVSLIASDDSRTRTLAGSVTATLAQGGFGVGGAVAYNQIGQLSNGSNGQGSLNIVIRDSEIDLASGGTLTLRGLDDSAITAIAAGITLADSFISFNGSVASTRSSAKTEF